MTRREITREERDRLVEIRPHNWASERIRIAEMSRHIMRRHLLAMRDRVDHFGDRRKRRKLVLEALADARVSTEEARRYGWKLP